MPETGQAINVICTSLLLVTASAGLSHLAIRYTHGVHTMVVSGIAVGLLGWALYLGPVLGGFWSGLYTLLCAYFLACMVMPWLDLAVRRVEGKLRAG